MARAIAAGALPGSLLHPVRNVTLARPDGGTFKADVCIGVITKVVCVCV